MIEATHTSEPEKMRNALLAELHPANQATPFQRLRAMAQPGQA